MAPYITGESLSRTGNPFNWLTQKGVDRVELMCRDIHVR